MSLIEATHTDNLEASSTVRKRTRATAEQLSVLEDTFAANVSPNSKLRKELSERLQMSERSIQIWFQNRRAKVKHMQKRAQMQMQQASIRAQLYHYHQQQYGMMQPYGGTPIMPLPQQVYHRQQRSSMDTPPPCTPSPNPIPALHLSYPPPQDCSSGELSDYLNAPLSPSSPQQAYLSNPLDLSSMPSLIAVPDAGPTAMLATCSSLSSSSSTTSASSLPLSYTPATTPPFEQVTVSPQDIWPSHQDAMRSQSVSIGHPCKEPEMTRSFSNPPMMMTTIDPSNLLMTCEDIYLNCTTLTVGTWHRLKLRSSDLTCTFKPTIGFEWQIQDAGCHFKMEIPLGSIANIDFIQDTNVLANVHFDISSLPMFYMETTHNGLASWVQCSDFTEGKQASRFFRHSLKGVAQHLKHDLQLLMDRFPETRRWIRFLDVSSPWYPAL